MSSTESLKQELLERGTIDEEDLAIYIITDNEDQIIEIVRNAPVHEGIQFTHKDLYSSGIRIEKKKNIL